MIHLQPTKNAETDRETIGQFLTRFGKEWQTKETSRLSPLAIVGVQEANILVQQAANKVNDVFRTVYGVEPTELNIKSRKRDIVYKRHAHRYWLCMYTNLSLREIGIISNNCDHSSVISSREAYRVLYYQDAYLKERHYKFIELMA